MLIVRQVIAVTVAVVSISVCGLAASPDSQTPEELAAACKREAGKFVPVTSASVSEAREQLRTRLTEFHRLLTGAGSQTSYWADYLLWTDTLRFLDATAPKDGATRILMRWRLGSAVWTAPELVAAADSIENYIAILQAADEHESAEQHAAAWNRLAELVAAAAKHDQTSLDRVAEAVVERERLGDAPELTRAIRRSLSAPDIMFRASADWFKSRLSGPVDESFQINGVYSGMSTNGAGRLTGDTSCELFPSPDALLWILWFNGATSATTSASGSGATINSRAATNLVGKQVFRLDGAGLSAKPCRAAAASAIAFDQISAGGRARYQQEATSRVYASRSQAEQETANANSRSLEEQMNKASADSIKRFNDSYLGNLRDQFIQGSELPPTAEFSSDETTIFGDWRWAQSRTFTAPSPPFHSPTALALAIDAAAIERFMAANVGGKRLTQEQFSRLVAPDAQPSPKDEKSPADRWLRLADKPCDVELANGRISLHFHLAEFESAGVQYPPMTAAAVYACQVDGDQLKLVRDGGFTARLVSDGESGGASGRQQTLQLAVRRFFNRTMPEQIFWPGPDKPSNRVSLPIANLQVKSVLVSDGWLQLSLATAPPAKK